jgi:hypothetical protein
MGVSFRKTWPAATVVEDGDTLRQNNRAFTQDGAEEGDKEVTTEQQVSARQHPKRSNRHWHVQVHPTDPS